MFFYKIISQSTWIGLKEDLCVVSMILLCRNSSVLIKHYLIRDRSINKGTSDCRICDVKRKYNGNKYSKTSHGYLTCGGFVFWHALNKKNSIGSESFWGACIDSWIAKENIMMHLCIGGSLHPYLFQSSLKKSFQQTKYESLSGVAVGRST
jgi:hypothetical protein